MIQQKFAATHADNVRKIQDAISQETSIKKALTICASPAATGGSAVQNRTLASPEWENDGPVNWRKNLTLSSISVSDFDASNTYHIFALWHSFGNMFVLIQV